MIKLHIVGVTGYPGVYGGFETLVNNLVEHSLFKDKYKITVYCGKHYVNTDEDALVPYNVERVFLPLSANGISSILFDGIGLIYSRFKRADVVLVLGVSGAYMFPLLRVFGGPKIICNIDGLEWRREKWGSIARFVLRSLEWFAVRFSTVVVSDNAVISKYLFDSYGVKGHLIEYGGDHASTDVEVAYKFPFEKFDYSLCRIEPENNIEMILSTYSKSKRNLIIAGNWEHSKFSRSLKQEYGSYANIRCMPANYDPIFLIAIRSFSDLYIHGHSAGGTNPSLVEAIHFDAPIIAYDCDFNRSTLENQGNYFSSSQELCEILNNEHFEPTHLNMRQKYSWDRIVKEYSSLI